MRTIVLSAGFLAFLLSGCSTGTVPGLPGTTNVVATGAHGIVRGGQAAVTGATITLWPVGTAGYGSSATALATTTTDSNGAFSITGSYTCPAANPYVYITSTGGNPGLAPGTNNTAISLMAALTDCNTLKTNAASTYIVINEVTTVASVYALAQFMNTSTGAIGSWSYANTGMKNAFSTVTNLVNTTTGTALATTPNGNGVAPQQEINTLADTLAPCVNTSSSGSTECTTLFGDVQGSPANTLQAALEIALHPGSNVAALFGIAVGTPPFVPTLSAAPNDWTVALSYSTGGAAPRGLGIDSLGNVWVANLNSGGTNSRLSKLNTIGVPQNGSPFGLSLNGVNALAIDIANDVWVGNAGNGTLIGYTNTGNTFSGPFTGLSSPSAMAFDRNDYLWIANFGNSSVAEFNTSNGSFISSGYTSQITTPFAIAMDASGNAWVGNASTVTELSSSGVASGASPISVGGVTSPGGIAIDGSSNVWVSNYPTGNVAELNSTGGAITGSGGYTAGGASSSNTIAIDGGGNVWVADRAVNRLSELTSAGAGITPSTGYQGGSLNAPKLLAIDGSGNVWVSNGNATTTGSISTTLSEFVGAAVPTIQPLALALQYGQIGKAPGSPIAVAVQSGALPYFTPTVSYSAQLYASGGNSGTYTWSLASGSLPSPLTLSSSGVISGTTALTGTYTIGVQACDSANLTNCSPTKTLTLTANTTIPAAGNESALTGSYAMLFQGYKNGSGTGLVYGADFLASIALNGAGTLTGEIDINNKNLGSTFTTSVTGYYSFGSDNRGTMVITPAGGSAIEFAIAGENFSGSVPQTLRMIEFDDTGSGTISATGSAIAKLQTSAAFTAATLNQSFAFGLQGETPCTNVFSLNPTCAVITPFGPLTVAGQFTGDNSNSITSGEEDAAGVSTTYNAIGLTGSYTNPDPDGRGTLSLAPSGSTYPAAGMNFVYYIVNSGEMLLMTRDGHATKSLLAGDALVQSGSLSTTTLTGNYVAYEESRTAATARPIWGRSWTAR